ncbi:MAG TPA: 4-(cytidine 5'-diphospho)-2-C-methyl-D-erythritol kinase [Bacteroidota bacterium]|jgi:4-diphosphocytidyl-2-C-methyl-D-erythritol kinase
MLKLRAYAKINLGLRILGERDDGYHDLETVFHRIDLFDELELEPSDGISMQCVPEGLPTDERNLCVRAALLLRECLRGEDGVKILLRKNIPAGAGLGGGSSDAAATLLGLVRLWRADIPFRQILGLALKLGSDVPYFLREGSACATGRGEILEYIHLEVPYWIVVVYPGIPVSTAWAYKHLKSASVPAAPAGVVPRASLGDAVRRDMHELRNLNGHLKNDFEPLVFGAHERVERARRALHEAGAGAVHLSGSGSALYGLFTGEEEARAAAAILERDSFVSVTPAHFEPSFQPVEL